jgi:adenosylmethionine-8-amino-7-oxononanoate aminotransferase
MSCLINRSLTFKYPVAVAGDGIYVIDKNGNRYLDGSSGAGVSCLGHSNTEVVEAMNEQAKKLSFASTVFYTTDIAEQLAEELVSRAPAGLRHVSMGNGGSEQVENAMKLARQYHVDTGNADKSIIIGREYSYHGMTIGTLGVSGHYQRRELYEPMLPDSFKIPPYFEYRHKAEGESIYEYSMRAAGYLEEKILQLGEKNVAAFICEPVVAATTGAVAANSTYFKRIREICDQYNVLLIFDEIFCGMGRTGTLYACEQEGVEPDILVMAKGLGAGYQPISAMLFSERIYQELLNGRGYLMLGHTYMSHPVTCAAALAVQNIIHRDNLLENVRSTGAYLKQRLITTFGDHPNIGDIRGRGLLLGLELVVDKQSKKPFDREKQLWKEIQTCAMNHGLMCYPNQGTVDGKSGDHILLAPPYIINEKECDELVSKLEMTLNELIATP